jgi:penicillin V acylase-like amidase (Ntn superfamily)
MEVVHTSSTKFEQLDPSFASSHHEDGEKSSSRGSQNQVSFPSKQRRNSRFARSDTLAAAAKALGLSNHDMSSHISSPKKDQSPEALAP